MQDWYLLHIEEGADGKLVYKNVKVLRATTPTHAAECKMRSRQDRHGGRQMRGGTVVFGTFRIA